MTNILAIIGDLTPILNELDRTKNPPVLYLSATSKNIDITILSWDNIRTDQTAFLLLNDTVIDIQKIKPLNPTGPEIRAGKAPIFTIPVATNFFAGNEYYIQIKVQDTTGNIGITKKLVFVVKTDPLVDSVKIDITEGAGGYNSDNNYLMPANIAVLRGPPGMHLTAHGKGAVRFQDVGGADHCNFYFDENGLSPLVLIKIDKIHIDSTLAATSQDEIIISHHKQNDIISSKPVIFGEYETPKDPLIAQSIESVSCNTTGIADGSTLCIVSIVFNKSYIDRTKDDTIYIKADSELNVIKNTYNKNFSIIVLKPNLPTVKIINYTAEFAITTNSPGKFNVAFFPSLNATAYWNKDIIFKSLL